MHIHINQQLYNTNALTLWEVLAEKKLTQKTGIAVALNQEVIPRSLWSEQKIEENDAVTIITATQGG
jgi:sulfur carrier protein